MLRNHNELILELEIRAICWWCHQHTHNPESDAWLVNHVYRDQDFERLNTLKVLPLLNLILSLLQTPN